jgi:hypothetical protein
MANDCSVSTTWEYRRVKISQRRRPQASRSPEASKRYSLSPWPRRERLELRVVSRGGSESWYEVRSRGCVWRFPGWLDLDSVMSSIYNDV